MEEDNTTFDKLPTDPNVSVIEVDVKYKSKQKTLHFNRRGKRLDGRQIGKLSDDIVAEVRACSGIGETCYKADSIEELRTKMKAELIFNE